MPIPTPAIPALEPRTAHGTADANSHVIQIIGGGRTAVGDRRPAIKPLVPIVVPEPPPVPKPPKMGCSGYRIKYGTSDELMIQAIREHAAQSVAETEGSPWLAASDLTDEQLLAVIGWSVLAKTACARVAKYLSDMSA